MTRPEETREDLAELMHYYWVHQMEVVFKKLVKRGKKYYIPFETINCWSHRMDAPYNRLSEQDKALNRIEADRIIKVLLRHTRGK